MGIVNKVMKMFILGKRNPANQSKNNPYVILPKGTIVKIKGITVEIAEDTKVYVASFDKQKVINLLEYEKQPINPPRKR